MIHLGEIQSVKIPLENYEEIVGENPKRGQDDLVDWMMDNKDILVLDETADKDLVSRVIDQNYASDLNDEELESLGRDPFLIAYALRDKAERCVVTTETSKPSRKRANRHIPDVCRDLGIHCCNTFEFVRRLNFTTG